VARKIIGFVWGRESLKPVIIHNDRIYIKVDCGLGLILIKSAKITI